MYYTSIYQLLCIAIFYAIGNRNGSFFLHCSYFNEDFKDYAQPPLGPGLRVTRPYIES